ncbi:MarR family transcriptional regulator [Cereibacter sphaeroides]|uniref:MarR family winged helix-turn-helix transcriptional regulator n=1 Tax=Cereibacter sphaeroides TaxID=1063 RepID=UPI001F3B853B|nr:MarR family transcriptional regulator [Cereibacter sphaeroides]MCE6950300.1 MarR family transcriptional regulator [Cereibacter sphaeroides]
MSLTHATERFTYRLDAIAHRAIASNDDLFVRETGLTILEVRLLRLIGDDPGTSFVEISQRIAVERTKISRMLQKLLSMELIRRENAREDARKFRLFVTDRGQLVRARSEVLSDRLEALLLAPLPTEEVAILNASLARILEWVSSPEYARRIAEVAGIPSPPPGEETRAGHGAAAP